MAIATSTAIALGLAAASAGASYYNTQRTAKNTDQALATQIRNQGTKQRQANARVDTEVDHLKASTAEKSRREGLDSYLQALLANRAKLHAGLGGEIGSQAFQRASANAATGVDQYANDSADLMARMDAPGQQRQDEAFGYGRAATDISLIAREAAGQNFIDQLMVDRARRRNPWLDALSAGLSGAAGAAGSGGLSGFGNSSLVSGALRSGTGVNTINNGLSLANYA